MGWKLVPGRGGYPGEGLQGGGSSCQVAPPWEGGGRGERRSITYIQTVVIRVLVVSLPEMEVNEGDEDWRARTWQPQCRWRPGASVCACRGSTGRLSPGRGQGDMSGHCDVTQGDMSGHCDVTQGDISGCRGVTQG